MGYWSSGLSNAGVFQGFPHLGPFFFISQAHPKQPFHSCAFRSNWKKKKITNILSSPLPFSYDENMSLCHPDVTQATSNFACPKIKAHPASSPQRLLFPDLSTPIPIQVPIQIKTSESLSQIFPVLLNPYPTGHQGLSLQCLITPLFPPPCLCHALIQVLVISGLNCATLLPPKCHLRVSWEILLMQSSDHIL